MNGIAYELDEKLKTLDPDTAASVERLVRDVLTLADAQRKASPGWPAGFFEATAGAFANEPFERPPQGSFETRDQW